MLIGGIGFVHVRGDRLRGGRFAGSKMSLAKRALGHRVLGDHVDRDEGVPQGARRVLPEGKSGGDDVHHRFGVTSCDHRRDRGVGALKIPRRLQQFGPFFRAKA